MGDRPSVVIVSCSSTKPKSLIKLITKSSNVSEVENKTAQSWSIETKYYTAEIDLIGITEDYKRTSSFNDNVEALIILMDTNKSSGLEDLSVWSQIEEDCDPEIKLLVASYCTNDTKITKAEATDWCLKHGFEFIELYPAQQDVEQDIIEEKVGVDRIVEALQTHTWSNMSLKSDKSSEGEFVDENDDFSDLFAQLSMMKESLQSVPMNQRKQCAEQVVTAFWKAIGGDEEEISDI